jgi:hypothetical protein
VNGPEWDDALLADLGRAYRNHPDVADLVAGVRAVLALHIPLRTARLSGLPTCAECGGLIPCDTVRALNHPEESP